MAAAFYLESAFVDRLRNAAFLSVLYGLRWGDARRDHGRHYDSVACALALFEILLEQSGLGTDLTRSDLPRFFFPFLRALDEAHGVPSDGGAHGRYLDDLLSDLSPTEAFGAEFHDFRQDRARRTYPFFLLQYHEGPADEPVLRLTSEAINIYVGMLPRDVTDVQRAAEYLIEEQLRRGHFSDAEQEARRAVQTSLAYQRELDAIIRHTRRDLGSVDWREDVPRRLAAADGYLGERIRAESAILDHVRGRLEETELSPENRAHLVNVQRLVGQTQEHHSTLLRTMTQTRAAYFEEQDGQFFLARRGPGVHLTRDVLTPLLETPAGEAARLLPRVEAAFAPRMGLGFNLAHLIEHLATPKRAVTRHEFEVEERVLEDFTYGEARFTPGQWERAWALLDVRGETLSAVLDRAADEPREVRDLIVLLALQGYCGDGFPAHEEKLTCDVGGDLDTPEFLGTDLAITRCPPREAP